MLLSPIALSTTVSMGPVYLFRRLKKLWKFNAAAMEPRNHVPQEHAGSLFQVHLEK